MFIVIFNVDFGSTATIPPPESTNKSEPHMMYKRNRRLCYLTQRLITDFDHFLYFVPHMSAIYTPFMTYHTGEVMASMQETYKHMLDMYKKYGDIKKFDSKKNNLMDMMKAYHIIQGDYFKIREDFNKFHEIKKLHLRKIEEAKERQVKWTRLNLKKRLEKEKANKGKG